jgi:hypothetical protein
MKQAIRALGWANAIFWIILLLFAITIVYSAVQIQPRFGEPSVTNSNGTSVVALPLSIYNGGFYDINKFSITTQISDNQGSAISWSSTLVPILPKGENTTIEHKMILSIEQAATSNLSYLLFNDSELNVQAIVKLLYANAFPVEISTNFTTPWGAPFASLTLGNISVISPTRVSMPLSFENHSFLEMNGTVRVEIVDNANTVIGGTSVPFDAPPETRFERNIEITVSGSPTQIREARLFYETPFFDYGPMVISLV